MQKHPGHGTDALTAAQRLLLDSLARRRTDALRDAYNVRGLFKESPFRDVAMQLAEACDEAAAMYERRRMEAALSYDAKPAQ